MGSIFDSIEIIIDTLNKNRVDNKRFLFIKEEKKHIILKTHTTYTYSVYLQDKTTKRAERVLTLQVATPKLIDSKIVENEDALFISELIRFITSEKFREL